MLLDRPFDGVAGELSDGAAASLAIGLIATVRFPDDNRPRAVVGAMPQLAMRLPPAMVDPFGLCPAAVTFDLLTRSHWPRLEQIQNPPTSVRFHYAWDSGTARLLGALLAKL